MKLPATTTIPAVALRNTTFKEPHAKMIPMPLRRDPYARLYRKGKGKSAQLCFMGHAFIENRHGLAASATFGLKAGVWIQCGRLDMVSPVSGT